MEFGKIGGAAIGQHDAAIAAIIGLAHRGVDADFGGHPAHQKILDAVFPQHVVEFGRVERALAGLVDDDLTVERIQCGTDVVAGFAADQDPPHRPGIADAQGWRAALDLGRRRVGQIGQMTLAGMQDEQSAIAGCVQHRRDRFHRTRKLRDIVAQGFAEAARLHEIALHVDDQKRRGRPVEIDRRRLGGDCADGCLL